MIPIRFFTDEDVYGQVAPSGFARELASMQYLRFGQALRLGPRRPWPTASWAARPISAKDFGGPKPSRTWVLIHC